MRTGKYNPLLPLNNPPREGGGRTLKGLIWSAILILALAVVYLITGFDVVQWVAEHLKDWGLFGL